MAGADGMAKGPLGGTATEGDDDILSEARERFQICCDAEDRTEALSDLRFLRGDQWDAEAAQARTLDQRPMLTINNIPAIVHQVTNDVRQNKQSIQVHPVDDGADVAVAKVIEGLVRHIEYDSAADAAYDTALDGAAQVGFGYFRLIAEYSGPMSFVQDLKIKRIRNQFTVQTDPNAQEADGSDMKFAFISSRMLKTAFKREYPNAQATSDALETATGDSEWWSGDYCRIAEYYRIEYQSAEIVLLGDGTVKLASDWKAPEHVVNRRTTQIPKTMWYKITGAEVLERREVPCPWIPVFPVYGDEIDIDGTVTRNGIIRHAKSPKMMENYWMTSATEEIAMRTKTPFIGALGAFEGIDDWNTANTRNYSYLEYNPVVTSTEDGQSHLAPPPQRQAPADVPTGFITMAGLARDAVKSVTGIYDASLGNRSNEVSGLAIRARQRQGDIANYHFTDNLTRAIRHLGRCMIAMIPKIYDTERVVRILGEDHKTATMAKINTPETKQDDRGDAIQTVLNDLRVGTYDVVVTTGPAYNTLREESLANMIELGGKWPKLMEVAGDKVIRAMDWPGAEEIADRVAKTLPPGLADTEDGDDKEPMVQTPKGPIPLQQAGQLIGQLDQTLEKLHADLQDAESGLAKARIDAASRERVAEINAKSKLDNTELAAMADLIMAKLNPALAHIAAVVAAGDPDHPAAAAPIAQAIAAQPLQPDPSDGAPNSDAGPSAAASTEGTE